MRQHGFRTVLEIRALRWLVLIAVVAILWIAGPFLVSILLGFMLAFALEPLNEAIQRRVSGPHVAPVVTTVFAGATIASALAGFVTLFVTRAVQIATAAREQIQSGGALSDWVAGTTRWLQHLGINSGNITEQIQGSLAGIASSAGTWAAALATGTFSTLLGLFFALLAMYTALRHRQQIVPALVTLSPLRSEHTLKLLGEFHRIGKTTLRGTIVTAVVQGALATVGYLISGAPYPFFYGITTAFASLLPAIGTLLIWVPIGIYLIANGHLVAGTVELVWGALVVVGLSDYVIRPRLVREKSMPALAVFVALFGGLEVMGIAGLIIGPLVMGVAVAVLRMYSQEPEQERNTEPLDPP
jgi:predicted PurR-regulated permease PerM